MTLPAIAEVVGGAVHDDPGQVTVTGPATTHSRQVAPGGLFAAFVGEHVDGHDYAGAAMETGAAAVLGSRPVGIPAVVVPDVQSALGRLARHVLAELRRTAGVTVVAVTGSQGKTSTKDLLSAVLAAAGPTVATHGSFNNEIGMPLTVLRAEEDTAWLVLEMGARGGGHLRTLCEIARPDLSVVLNVGKAHLGEFGSQDAIAAAKGELVEALDADGVAVLNADDPRVAAMAARTRGRVVTFGRSPGADLQVSRLHLDASGHPSFTLTAGARLQRRAGTSAEVALQLVGEHQADNAAAAAATALAGGVPLAAVARRLESVEALSRWRMEVTRRTDGLTVLNDSYNANPDSMAAALRSLVALAQEPGVRTVAVLGEMRELGASSAAEHEAVGRLAVELHVDRVVVVGEAAATMYAGAVAAGQDGSVGGQARELRGEEPVLMADNRAAIRWLYQHLGPRDVVLVKASRAARLDEVAQALLTPEAAGG